MRVSLASLVGSASLAAGGLLFSAPAAADGVVPMLAGEAYVAKGHSRCVVGDTVSQAAANFRASVFPGGVCADTGLPGPTPYLVSDGVWGPVPQQDAGCGMGDTAPDSMLWGFRVDSKICPTWGEGTTTLGSFGVVKAAPLRCPPNATQLPNASGLCRCNQGFARKPDGATCAPKFDLGQAHKPRDACSNPQGPNALQPLFGAERKTVRLGIALAGEELVLTYDTSRRVDASTPDTDPIFDDDGDFGALWFSSLHRRLRLAPGGLAARVSRGDGYTVSFMRSGSGFVADSDENSRLIRAGSGYRYSDMRANAVEHYDAAGLLTRIERASGTSIDFFHSDTTTPASVAPGPGYLLRAQDAFGRSAAFEYDSSGRVSKVTDPRGLTIVSRYAADNLTELLWQDQTARGFRYTQAGLPWALTQVIDERSAVHASLAYDGAGRAVSSSLAGGAQSYSVTYAQGPLVAIRDVYDPNENLVLRASSWTPPQGIAVTSASFATYGMTAETGLGVNRVRSQSQPAGSGCSASTSEQRYDGRGNVVSRDDFNGNRQCFAHEPTRNFETTRVEGLVAGANCTALVAANAQLAVGLRKVSTEWHPGWRLKERVAEPRRITSYVYNGRPYPSTAGGATASCAPGHVVALCMQIESATADPDGALGFAAPLEPGVPARVQTWTYNEHGQVLTHDGPRTDVVDITTHEYYTATSFTGADPNAVGQTRGDLKQSTSPAGHVTRYTLYNKLGQLLESVDPNGVVTRHTYDLRQRLTSTTVGGHTTTFDYWPTGLIKRITQPDGSWVHHDHDAAHRLVGVSDSLGNRITYTLDNMGNRTAEWVTDPAGTLRRSVQRGIDALGRVQRLTGREMGP